ncbi:DGQHR domain-containing protein [Flavobacterium sp.]|uniref:DGQHR domain-containing protein n=1 Tax=Flavobacterium sp. TaxID=239 RepID=UPI0040333B03
MIKDNLIIAQRVRQNNQEFLVSVFSIRQILTFTKHTERIIDYFDEDNMPHYNKRVQRKVSPTRAEEIADFLLDDPDAIFPTNIVLAIPNAIIESIDNLENGNVAVTVNNKVFSEISKDDGDVYMTIIDGQHRIKGIETAISRLRNEINNFRIVIGKAKQNADLEAKLDRKNKQLNNLLNINLLVSFFIDPTLEFQAMIFSTINRTQKSVPQSLVTSLFGLTESDTPQKTALEVVLALNGYESSPFYNRIKLHGGAYGRNQNPPLTQAAMVKSIVDLISTNNRELERDRFRERKELLININPDLPFRKYYANNEDLFITDILFSFFTAVRETFKKGNLPLWDFEENTKPTNVLQTTVGYNALLKILIDILKIEINDSRRDKVDTYKEYLVKTTDLEFDNQQRYPFTSVTKTILYLDMSIKIWVPTNSNDDRLQKRDDALKKRT